jgi:DNA-binding beta-propeller fold protein YncE
MRLTLRSFLLLGGLLSGLAFAYGCWREQDVPTELDFSKTKPRLLSQIVQTLDSPARLAVTADGALLVSDTRLGMIVGVDPVTLQAGMGFKVEGGPLAVGATRKAIFVGNLSRRTVEIYDARKGRLKGNFGPGAVGKPTDLAVDESARLVFVLDAEAMDVKVFDLRGRHQVTISGPGQAEAQLMHPMGIAVDPLRGEVLVSMYGDYGAFGNVASVKIFDYDGNYIATISGAGKCGMLGCSGGFSTPQGLAVDGQGRIYLTDVLQAQVQVYDRSTLELVATLGGRDVYPRLRKPLDAAMGREGELFVTSNKTRAVEVFYNAGGQP